MRAVAALADRRANAGQKIIGAAMTAAMTVYLICLGLVGAGLIAETRRATVAPPTMTRIETIGPAPSEAERRPDVRRGAMLLADASAKIAGGRKLGSLQ